MTEITSPKIAMIGGGSGTSTLLPELVQYTPEITAIVNMSDDGGSSGKLRDAYGVMPPGDMRQCLAALSSDPDMRDRFKYRYTDGELAGHAVGNLILSRMELDHGLDEAVRKVSGMLQITGKVVPITLDAHELVMEDGDEVIRGEFAVAYRQIADHGSPLYLEPRAMVHPEAEAAIHQADLVVIAPGNLYGSLLPALAVDGVAQALQQTSARKLVVANLLNTPLQTPGWHVVDYIQRLEAVVGEGVIDDVLYNNQRPDERLLRAATKPGEQPVHIHPERFDEIAARGHGDMLLAGEVYTPDAGDKAVPRSQIRHDAKRVGEHIMHMTRVKEAIA